MNDELAIENKRLKDALLDAAAHLLGASSAYKQFACRHKSKGKGQMDPFYSTRVDDFESAAFRAQQAVQEHT
jgi:hypothetical protein